MNCDHTANGPLHHAFNLARGEAVFAIVTGAVHEVVDGWERKWMRDRAPK